MNKADIRKRARTLRQEHVAALPDMVRALVFSRPPTPVAGLAGQDVVIGLYASGASEAPTLGYAGWFHERGHRLALPWFENGDAPMMFRVWQDPYVAETLEPGPFGIAQPLADAEPVTPDIAFVPLLAFTASGDRLGQGTGHYDRWLAEHPDTVAIGLAWDCQLVDSLPVEDHDKPLRMVVTPTRLFEGKDR